MKAKYPYSFEEFRKHHKDFIEIVRPRIPKDDMCLESILPRLWDYMGEWYLDKDEMREKSGTFCSIQFFLAKHAEEFNIGKLAVIGDEQGLISEDLLRAAHHLFTSKTLSEIDDCDSVKEVKLLAEQFARDAGR